jgi:hypothetical protein
MRTKATLLALFTTAALCAALPAFADQVPMNANYVPPSPLEAQADTTKQCSGIAEATVSNNYVYQQTAELDSRVVTGQAEVYVTCDKWTPDVLGIYSGDFREAELNLYYDDSIKLPAVGELKYEAMSGYWFETDGSIIPLYGEISKDFTAGKGKVSITPFVGYGQWFGFDKEPDRGYVQAGVRLLTHVTSKVSLALEGAFAHCVKEDAEMTSNECRDAPYVNTEVGYDLGHEISAFVRARFTEGEPAYVGFTIRKSFDF